MVRKEELIEIKKYPEKLEDLIESRKGYRERVKNDPVRHEHWKEMHRLHGKRRYQKHKKRLSKEAKERYASLSGEEKIERRKRTKINRIKRRKKFILEWGGKCQKCGYSEHQEILEFDHKVPLYRKTNGVKKLVSDHMLKEVKEHPERFELLCPNCHRIKTLKEITELWNKKKKDLKNINF